MQGLLDAAVRDPWGTMELLLDGPLHPGGTESTETLLERAGVGTETRLVDVGCGAGQSLALARERGADVVGIDHDPPAGGVRGDLAELPVGTGTTDVVLAECVTCLLPPGARPFEEVGRVLAPGGRLALSDVVVEEPLDNVPTALAEPLCLTTTRSQQELRERIERAGLEVVDAQGHREDLLAMRDELQEAVDYEGLFRAMGEEGTELLNAVGRLEKAVEDGRIGYISLVAETA